MRPYREGFSPVDPEQGPGELDIRAYAFIDRHTKSLCRSRHASWAGIEQKKLLGWGHLYFPYYFKLPPSPLHRWLEEQYDAAITVRGVKLNLVGPRGAAKSTVGTLTWVLRAAVEGREPYIWIVSDTHHQAVAHLENVKQELLANEKLAADYPAACGRGPIWRAGTIVLANGVMIEAFGTGVRMRGRRRREHRPTLIVCDDLQNDGHMESARQRMLSSRWFHGTLLKAGTRRTNVVNLATALHRDAVAMELCRTPGWNSRVFPAIVRWPDATALWSEWEALYCDLNNPTAAADARRFYEEHWGEMDAGAELLWPEAESLYALMCMRIESGRTAFEREKQGVPINPQLCEWPEEYFDHEQFWFDAWPADVVVKTLSLDPSKGSDARHGDYSAIVALAIDAAGAVYVEADLARRTTPQMTVDAVEWWARFEPHAFCVEANQYQELLGDELVRVAVDRGRPDFAPYKITNTAAKSVRIRRLSPLLAGRRLRFRAASPGTKLLVDQLRDFPCGDHDDGPDALEMAYRLAQELLEESETERVVGVLRME